MDPDRYLPAPDGFATLFNLRDLGGHRTSDGRVVRRGVLYRSDALFRLAGEDLDRFAALRICSVLDLRRPDELAADGRVPELPGLLYRNINLQRDTWTTERVEPSAMPGYLADRYAEMADEALRTGAMAAALRFLVSTPTPAVFHCLAGKDRTGVIAALLLSLLEVPEQVIAADYAASQYSEDRYLAWRAVHRPELAAVGLERNACPPEAILAFLAGLRDRYGSVVGYLEHTGLDGSFRAEVRERLLDGEPWDGGSPDGGSPDGES